MQKVFFISRNSDKYENRSDVNAPSLDRFQRVEQLNEMLALGWSIKDFKTSQGDSYFLLEKDDWENVMI